RNLTVEKRQREGSEIDVQRHLAVVQRHRTLNIRAQPVGACHLASHRKGAAVGIAVGGNGKGGNTGIREGGSANIVAPYIKANLRDLTGSGDIRIAIERTPKSEIGLDGIGDGKRNPRHGEGDIQRLAGRTFGRDAPPGNVEFERGEGDRIVCHNQAYGPKKARGDLVLAQRKLIQAEAEAVLFGSKRATRRYVRSVHEGCGCIESRVVPVGSRIGGKAGNFDARSIQSLGGKRTFYGRYAEKIGGGGLNIRVTKRNGLHRQTADAAVYGGVLLVVAWFQCNVGIDGPACLGQEKGGGGGNVGGIDRQIAGEKARGILRNAAGEARAAR